MVFQEGFKCLWSDIDRSLLFVQHVIFKTTISPSQSDHVTPEKKSGFSSHHDCSSDDAYTPDHNCHYSSVGDANYEG